MGSLLLDWVREKIRSRRRLEGLEQGSGPNAQDTLGFPGAAEQVKAVKGTLNALQFNEDPGLFQRTGVGEPLVPQTVELLYLNIGGRKTGKIRRFHGGGIGALSAVAPAQIELPHSAVQPGIPEGTVREAFHGSRVHPRVCDGIEQHLVAQPDLRLIPRPERTGGGKGSSGTVAPDGDGIPAEKEFVTVIPDVAKRGAAILKGNGKRSQI